MHGSNLAQTDSRGKRVRVQEHRFQKLMILDITANLIFCLVVLSCHAISVGRQAALAVRTCRSATRRADQVYISYRTLFNLCYRWLYKIERFPLR